MSVSDTVYTERYMGLANSNDNFRGYDVSGSHLTNQIESDLIVLQLYYWLLI